MLKSQTEDTRQIIVDLENILVEAEQKLVPFSVLDSLKQNIKDMKELLVLQHHALN